MMYGAWRKAPATHRAPRSLSRYLWGWTLLALLLVWVTLALVAYYTGTHEADEIHDGQLQSTTNLLLNQTMPWGAASAPFQSAPDNRSNSYVPILHAVVWDAGEVRWDTHGVAPQLPAQLQPGHHTLSLSVPPGSAYRSWRLHLAESTVQGVHRRVAVYLDTERRSALGRDIAEHIVRPAFVMLPLLAWIMAWAIRRGLRPLQELSSRIEHIDVDAGQTLEPRQPYRELVTTVSAINALAQRLQRQVERERRFASDVAHELRTPLTALVWQARRASESQGGADQAQALQHIERDALRAGRILTQLLALARAQNLAAGPQTHVELGLLAQQVVQEHVALAYERGQDLALAAPEYPVHVRGEATMLELALRNLVDNALRHNPPGASAEVRLEATEQGAVTLAVYDSGEPCGPAPLPSPTSGTRQAAAPEAPDRQGLGIGLTLVRRIAQSHGAELVHGTCEPTPQAPYRQWYALAWPGRDGPAAPSASAAS